MKAKKTLKSRIRGWFPQEPKLLGKTVQNTPNLEKKRLLLVGVVVLLAVILALAVFQVPRLLEGVSPKEVDIRSVDSNLLLEE